MSSSKPKLKIDEVAPRFTQLLTEEGTSLETPTLAATWRAFSALGHEIVDCDTEKLFFEADLSPSKPDSFYVHFTRTFYGREPGGHVWSSEVICDFLFPLDETLEEFNSTVEAEDLVAGGTESDEEREAFFADVESEEALWKALKKRQPTETQIYVGES